MPALSVLNAREKLLKIFKKKNLSRLRSSANQGLAAMRGLANCLRGEPECGFFQKFRGVHGLIFSDPKISPQPPSASGWAVRGGGAWSAILARAAGQPRAQLNTGGMAYGWRRRVVRCGVTMAAAESGLGWREGLTSAWHTPPLHVIPYTQLGYLHRIVTIWPARAHNAPHSRNVGGVASHNPPPQWLSTACALQCITPMLSTGCCYPQVVHKCSYPHQPAGCPHKNAEVIHIP